MSSLQITNPTNNTEVQSHKPVTFTGKADSDITTVKLIADDQWPLGSDNVDANGMWSITYSGFTRVGKRKITATPIGFDDANQNYSIYINVIFPQNEYTIDIYNGLCLDAYKNLEHTQNTTVDRGLSKEEGRKLFEMGILPLLQSKDAFMEATAQGRSDLAQRGNYLDIKNAPCAYSVSCVMKYIAEKLGFDKLRQVFNDTFAIDCVQVTGVEKKLRRLGFLYFSKQDYLAPRGAIGALTGRHHYQGTRHGSDHIYLITKDGEKRTEFPNPDEGNLQDILEGKPEKVIEEPKWKIKDLHAENLHFFDHVYMQWTNNYTDGFWLPPGIYPLKR